MAIKVFKSSDQGAPHARDYVQAQAALMCFMLIASGTKPKAIGRAKARWGV